ncbi:flagellar biosynthetic protein FliR [Novosphingobium sp. PhB165]|uniref:flagellar biosynthetic protein FliR n=1 Tax=Novosphingobium sp. PhB165 TaxID=2485105 RepID=UPI00104AF0EA|nr:flagellar biosynthetic protein FliR [Novosphingobium sp. PhB165]TCM17733.1 flagellar biosynthetic protein FliR [Novosphingobium sp. PhB165]
MDAALLAALPVDATTFLILFTRVGAVVMLLPAFSEESVPAQIRLVMALGLSVGLYGLLAPRIGPVLQGPQGGMANLPIIVIAEMLVGLAFGSIVKIMFTAAAIAGSMATQQVGLSSALVNDPSMGGQSPLLSRLFGLAAVLVCMAFGVHHLWIEAIVRSYSTFPVGGMPPAADFAQLAIHVTGQAMALGVSLAAPLILYGALFNLGLGLAARVAPQIQVFFITQPLNLMLGISLVGVTLGSMLTAFASAMTAFMQDGWKF